MQKKRRQKKKVIAKYFLLATLNGVKIKVTESGVPNCLEVLSETGLAYHENYLCLVKMSDAHVLKIMEILFQAMTVVIKISEVT